MYIPSFILIQAGYCMWQYYHKVPQVISHREMQLRGMCISWWRHQMETFSALLVLFEGNSPVTGEFPSQGPVTRTFDVFFDLRLNKRLSKPSRRRWFETPSRSLWRHCNVSNIFQGWLSSSFSVKSSCRWMTQASVKIFSIGPGIAFVYMRHQASIMVLVCPCRVCFRVDISNNRP